MSYCIHNVLKCECIKDEQAIAVAELIEAAREAYRRRATTIFIDEPEHVEHFFKGIGDALAKLEGSGDGRR